MVRAVVDAVKRLFADISRSQSAMRRVLNPSMEGAGSRVYPPQVPKKDADYGIRVDRGEKVHDKPNVLRLKLQLNSNATNKTIRELAKQDPHRVFATVDVDVTQEPTADNLKKIEAELVKQL
ncbi:hypothetical protein GX50_03122 [[Emmonsia] crescens]|uniref:Uncharacterized protein n=1 Tax=[Emmonsia] crescens TaxID=73230 RepID=A0A2B7ZJB3_9EURO|nr:hypothetical protein GX50_03122 [Emmonsia crescens]